MKAGWFSLFNLYFTTKEIVIFSYCEKIIYLTLQNIYIKLQ